MEGKPKAKVRRNPESVETTREHVSFGWIHPLTSKFKATANNLLFVFFLSFDLASYIFI